MVARYSRDDVLPALRAQLHVLRAIRRGWFPLTPQARGAKSPLQEVGIDVSNSAPLLVPPGVDPVGEQVDAGTDTEDTSNSSSCSSSDSESEIVEDEVDGEEDAVAQQPQFLVNRITACFHAVISLNGRCGRACAPRCPVDAPHWELFDTDPVDLEDALVPCSHSACVRILEQV